MNRLITDKEFCLKELWTIARALSDTPAPEAEKQRIGERVSGEAAALREDAAEKAGDGRDQEEHEKRYGVQAGAKEADTHRRTVEARIGERKARGEEMERFIQQVEERDGVVEEFDAVMWAALVREVTVGEDGMVFKLNDGTDISM